MKAEKRPYETLDKIGLIGIYLASLIACAVGIGGLVMRIVMPGQQLPPAPEFSATDFLVVTVGGLVGCLLSGWRYVERFAEEEPD